MVGWAGSIQSVISLFLEVNRKTTCKSQHDCLCSIYRQGTVSVKIYRESTRKADPHRPGHFIFDGVKSKKRDKIGFKKNQGLTGLNHKPLVLLARPAGFEPAAYGFVDRTTELPNLLKIRYQIDIIRF